MKKITFAAILLIAVSLMSCKKDNIEPIECWECYKESIIGGQSTGTKVLFEGCMTESEIFSLHPVDTLFAVPYDQMTVFNCKKQ